MSRMLEQSTQWNASLAHLGTLDGLDFELEVSAFDLLQGRIKMGAWAKISAHFQQKVEIRATKKMQELNISISRIKYDFLATW